ncbi:MAG TPA: hypothetical protein VHO06_21930 [Polyangia bacterium]|nr:hypothetical protein [Polyangia bacterium]
MVVAPEPGVARWAAQPIVLGPGNTVRLWVLGADRVPDMIDAARARAAPELAVLSVMAHGKGDPARAVAIAAAAAAGVEAVEDRELVLLYSDLIGAALGAAARRAFQMLPHGYEFQTDAIREAIAKGRTEGSAAAVLEVLEARGLPVSDEQRRRVRDCKDLDVLARWHRRAVTVASAGAIFGELDE